MKEPHSIHTAGSSDCTQKTSRQSNLTAGHCIKAAHVTGSMLFARWCQCVPPPNTCLSSLSPPKFKSQTASWMVQPFLHSWRQTVAILYNGPPLFPLSTEGIWTPCNTRFLGGPSKPTTQTAFQSVQPLLQG